MRARCKPGAGISTEELRRRLALRGRAKRKVGWRRYYFPPDYHLLILTPLPAHVQVQAALFPV